MKAGKGEEEQVGASCCACSWWLPVLLSPSTSSWAFSFSFDSSKENTGMDSMAYSKRNVAESIMSPLIQQAKVKSFNSFFLCG